MYVQLILQNVTTFIITYITYIHVHVYLVILYLYDLTCMYNNFLYNLFLIHGTCLGIFSEEQLSITTYMYLRGYYGYKLHYNILGTVPVLYIIILLYTLYSRFLYLFFQYGGCTYMYVQL